MSDSRSELQRAIDNIIDVFHEYAIEVRVMGTSECAMLQPKERRVLNERGLRQLVKDQLPDMPQASSVIDEALEGNDGEVDFKEFTDLVRRVLNNYYENTTA